MIATETVRLNLGSGRYPLDDWTNVDLHCDADILADFRNLAFDDVETIRMSHLLEHISWRETDDVLRQVRGWLRVGGVLQVEVPDMDAILKLGTVHPLWHKYVYGDQSHEGEYHRAGFTRLTLQAALVSAGFQHVEVKRFISDHPGREGMPVLQAVATR